MSPLRSSWTSPANPSIQQTSFAFSDLLLGSIDITNHDLFYAKSRFLHDRPRKPNPRSIFVYPESTPARTSSNERNMLSRAVRAIPGRALVAASLRPAVVATTRQIAPLVTPVIRRKYHEKVLDRTWAVLSLLAPAIMLTFAVTDYSRPRNVGTLDKSDSSVGEGLVGAPAVCTRQYDEPRTRTDESLTVR